MQKMIKKKRLSPRKKAKQEEKRKKAIRTTLDWMDFYSASSDMNATYRNAIAYAQQEMNACRAKSYNVTPIQVQGPDGIYTGYRVTFSYEDKEEVEYFAEDD
ncbi:hypothetical protein [Sharpea azabuensis]|uniref:Uncharacterized protein n=1 Tax=Sharpea azabuensis TaxID=322505 RepID=A0A1H6SHY4_9FIRM|nr:hypothetical protein [Sharpea azabuensis]SEI66516.1 hypothetical protein SAMN04487834_101535 [Sharpea azabuensis]